jgi:hypothetical protein
MPEAYLKASSVEKDIEIKIYQMNIWHKKFADLLNIVVIVKTNMKTQAVAHVVLFRSDLAISYEQLIDYYRLGCGSFGTVVQRQAMTLLRSAIAGHLW